MNEHDWEDDGQPPIEREWSSKFIRCNPEYIDSIRIRIKELIKAEKNPEEIVIALMASNNDRLEQYDIEQMVCEVFLVELKKLGSH